ncbi:hypothetical protein [Mesorhizobium sp. LjNodule214]|uniref:hypothetical protein n=1 Tax=Mesorhizobium sp. LjNodule214 TaxID=3342252 RepID=UPI003ECF65FA
MRFHKEVLGEEDGVERGQTEVGQGYRGRSTVFGQQSPDPLIHFANSALDETGQRRIDKLDGGCFRTRLPVRKHGKDARPQAVTRRRRPCKIHRWGTAESRCRVHRVGRKIGMAGDHLVHALGHEQITVRFERPLHRLKLLKLRLAPIRIIVEHARDCVRQKCIERVQPMAGITSVRGGIAQWLCLA